MIKRYLYPSSVCLKKLRFAATCPNLLPTAVHVPRLLKLHPTTKFVLSRTASTNSQSGLNNEFTSHRYYSKSQPLDKKPKQRRSYKFFIFSVISALVSLHLISLIFRKRYKNKKVRETHGENYKTHQDPFCQGTSGILLKIGKFWLPSEFFKEKYKIQQIKEFTIVDGDILVASFPKSGRPLGSVCFLMPSLITNIDTNDFFGHNLMCYVMKLKKKKTIKSRALDV
jgi:hypothetical protein